MTFAFQDTTDPPVVSRKGYHMNEFSQVATAMLAIAFAALMLLVGELYIQNKGDQFSAKAIRVSSVNGLGRPLILK